MTVKIKVIYNPNFQKHPQDCKVSTAFIPQFPKILFSFS